MILVDLVGSISRALPELVALSARRRQDEMVFGAKVGYAFVSPHTPGAAEPAGESVGVESADTWSGFQGNTVGILGASRIGQAVARITSQRFAADVIYDDSTSADGDLGEWGRRCSFDDLIAARTLCLELPWSADVLGQIQTNKHAQVDSESVLVVWRRSLAIERALIYIGQHYVEPIQLSDLAKVACVSKCHLVRRFSATLGVSPHRFQLLLRLSRAKTMLREGTSITHVAQGVGFFDHSHLDRSFRVLLGMTPTQYQQSVDR
jgi:AraC family transcriptional regulator